MRTQQIVINDGSVAESSEPQVEPFSTDEVELPAFGDVHIAHFLELRDLLSKSMDHSIYCLFSGSVFRKLQKIKTNC
jgi:hypothetical protein